MYLVRFERSTRSTDGVQSSSPRSVPAVVSATVQVLSAAGGIAVEGADQLEGEVVSAVEGFRVDLVFGFHQRVRNRLVPAGDDPHAFPDGVFMFVDTMVVFDHLRHKVLVISLVDAGRLRDVEGEGFAAAYRRAADDVRRVAELMLPPTLPAAASGATGAPGTAAP
jgi:anthranilate/para-aminobenzoate synthase component I